MEHSLKVVAIIQARMASERLPGKVLADLCGKPLLERLIERVKSTQNIEKIVVATTDDESDDILTDWCKRNRTFVFRGSSNDVLDRIWNCAKTHPAEYIVRVTADDPLKDPELISKAIDLCSSDPLVDYASNTINPTYPEGLDIEVFRYRALERASQEAYLPSDREHVTPYLWKNPDRFVLRSFDMQPNLSRWRLTIDRPEDLELMRKIFDNFSTNPLVSYREVIDWLNNHPELLTINSGYIRNEGYLKSVAQEQLSEQKSNAPRRCQ